MKVVINLENLQVVSVSADTTVPVGARAGSKTSLILEVKYSDGSVMYRCSKCGKEFAKWTSTFAHHSSHSETKSATWKAKRDNKSLHHRITEISEALNEVLAMLDAKTDTSELATLHASLDEERKARRKAEGDLKKIRSLLTPAPQA